MTQVLVEYDPLTQYSDAAVDDNGFISLGAGLETAVAISLFTDKRARPSDRVESKRGWWGDTVHGDQAGSLLWLLARSHVTNESMREAQLYAQDALAWMITDGIAKSVTVDVRRLEADSVLITPRIVRPDGSEWSKAWEVTTNALQSANT